MNYKAWVRDKLGEITGLKVYGLAVPAGENTPRDTRVFTSFNPPTRAFNGTGIVSKRDDVHRLVFYVRVSGRNEEEVEEVMDKILWGLTDEAPPDCSPIESIIGETWSSLDSKTRPQEYNAAISFMCYTNLEGKDNMIG